MKQNEENIYRIDTDKAWNTLYARLEKENLLSDMQPNRKFPFYRIAVAATVCLGIIFSVFYYSHKNNRSLSVLQNKEKSGALVITLNDGSTVYLAPNASISYPSAFAEDQRKVKLTGNALFCVAKNEKCPFFIETNEKIMIEVVGTIFAVQSYPGNPFELSVKQGKVNVQAVAGQANFPVEAGETARLNPSGLTKSRTGNLMVFSRFTDKMSFKDEKLSNIVHAINAMYGSPAIITDESINNRTLTVTFDNDSVETMSELICLALNLEHVNKQDTIFIRK